MIVAQGIEAGGHVRGTTGLLPLLDEIRTAVDGPVIAAGGIGTGRAMAAAITAGADGVRVGTRFLVADGANAHADYVDALIAATADDTVVTTTFGDGWPDAPHRVLRSAVEAAQRITPDQLGSPEWPHDGDEGPVDGRCLYAGQSVARSEHASLRPTSSRRSSARPSGSWIGPPSCAYGRAAPVSGGGASSEGRAGRGPTTT